LLQITFHLRDRVVRLLDVLHDVGARVTLLLDLLQALVVRVLELHEGPIEVVDRLLDIDRLTDREPGEPSGETSADAVTR
jgi:hypothetical protein